MTEQSPPATDTYYEPLKNRLLIVLPIVAVSIALDRWTKVLAFEYLSGRPRISYLGDIARLDFAKNPGAFLSLGAALSDEVRSAVFSWAVAGLLAFLTYIVLVRPALTRVVRIGLALVLGGGLGNLYDRVFEHGLVTDFMNLGIGPVRTGIFNVADLAIVAGVVLLALPQKKTDAKAPQPVTPNADEPRAP